MEEKIETSKNHFANKTRMIPVINLAAMNYRSVAFLRERRKTFSCHFNLRNTWCGMTSYDGHSHPP